MGPSAGLPGTPFSGDATVAEISPLFDSAAAEDSGVAEHCSGIAGTGAELRCQTVRYAVRIRSIGNLLTRKRIAVVALASTQTSSSIFERHPCFSGANIPKGASGWMAESFNLNSLGRKSSSLWALLPEGTPKRRFAMKTRATSPAPCSCRSKAERRCDSEAVLADEVALL